MVDQYFSCSFIFILLLHSRLTLHLPLQHATVLLRSCHGFSASTCSTFSQSMLSLFSPHADPLMSACSNANAVPSSLKYSFFHARASECCRVIHCIKLTRFYRILTPKPVLYELGSVSLSSDAECLWSWSCLICLPVQVRNRSDWNRSKE